jgi:hypothetical protein
VEVGLACIAHNIRKKAYKDAKTPTNNENKPPKDPKKSKPQILLKVSRQYPQIYSMVA